MFAKRLRHLISIRERVSNLRLVHSTTGKSNLNLTHCYQQRRNDLYLPVLLSEHTSRHYANYLQTNKTQEHEDNCEFTKSEEISEKNTHTENEYAYSILRRSDRYNTIIPPLSFEENVSNEMVHYILTKSYADCSPAEVLEDFRILSCHAKMNSLTLSAEHHDRILCLLKIYLDDLTDEELWDLMRYMSLWFPMKKTSRISSYEQLQQAIDKQCTLRMRDWNAERLLMVCDLVHQEKYVRHSEFVTIVVKKLGHKPLKLTAENYLHFMFLFNISRRPAFNMYEFEYALESIVDKFDAEELSIVAMAFFKTRTPIRNPALLNKIIEKCIAQMDSMDEIAITALMKIIRYSLDLKGLNIFKRLLEALKPRISTVSSACLVHTGHAAASILLYEKEIVDAIVHNFTDKIVSARLKELERMLFVLTMFSFPKEMPQYNLILKELRNPQRAEELPWYPDCLKNSLLYLGHAGIYPLDLIEKAMDHEYLAKFYKNNPYAIGPTYLSIDSFVRIEAPEYKGPFLPPKIFGYLSKRYSMDPINYNNPQVRVPSQNKFFGEVIHYTKEILGPNCCVIDQLLPQFQRSFIVLCIDEKNNFVSPTPFFHKLPGGSIKYAPSHPPGYKWIVVHLASHNNLLRNTNELSGHIKTVIRQLEKIGYKSISIPHTIWQDAATSDKKKEYLQELLEQCKNNNKTSE